MAEIPHHVAMMPTPGMGHLIPMVELAKRLHYQHNFIITIIVPSNCRPSTAQKSVLESLPAAINHVFLPPIDTSDVLEGDDTRVETLVSLIVVHSLPSLRDLFKSLTGLVALVVDLFGTDAFDVAKEFNLSTFLYFPASAMALSLFLYLPMLDEIVSCEYRDVETVRIPGCIPIHGKELLDPVQERTNEAYKWTLYHAKRFREADGLMVNSFIDLEPGAIKALQEKEPRKPPVYPVGPLVNMDGSGCDHECLRWLDEQPHGSILFVSFGSGGTLSHDQITELAYGLEMSEQKFLWVVRSPNAIANSNYFSAQTHKDPFDFLPKGFLDRTKQRSLVLASWAPQAQVLAHSSTGGFLTHCGWNSTLESIMNGVPLVLWPLYAEQEMNAVLLNKDIQVGLRPIVGENGLISREEIANVVRILMDGEEGKKVKNRIKELEEAAARVLSKEGSSTTALSEVAFKWNNQYS